MSLIHKIKSLSAIHTILILGFAVSVSLFFCVLSFPPASHDGGTDEFLALTESLIERGEFESNVNSTFSDRQRSCTGLSDIFGDFSHIHGLRDVGCAFSANCARHTEHLPVLQARLATDREREDRISCGFLLAVDLAHTHETA
jgi:hypothetical protein